jgi:hypothetical protein
MSRRDLQFEEAVQEAFGFLVTEYGFRAAESADGRVRYESGNAFVEIGSGRYGQEVGLECGRTGTGERFDLQTYLGVVSPRLRDEVGDGIVDTPEAMRRYTAALAGLLRTHGRPALEGDPRVFALVSPLGWAHFNQDAVGPREYRDRYRRELEQARAGLARLTGTGE